MSRRVALPFLALAVAACAADAGLPAAWTEPAAGMSFLLVRPGAFDMGLLAPPGDVRPAPPHRVRLTRPFYLGRTEVTQAQWERVMGTRPWRFPACDACPVETVSWYDAQRFLERLQELSPGERFRLPTEAEWEYACRAGGAGRYGGAVDTLRPELANYDGRLPFDGVVSQRFPGQPLPVESYPANPWGFHDLVGNVWEWTADPYCAYVDGPVTDPAPSCATDTAAIRGGSWFFSASAARCGRRYIHAREDSGFSLGFRVVREAP